MSNDETTVTVSVAFKVRSKDGAAMPRNVAYDAADLAAYHFLALVKESTRGGAVDEVEVHVDGFGACAVSLVED